MNLSVQRKESVVSRMFAREDAKARRTSLFLRVLAPSRENQKRHPMGLTPHALRCRRIRDCARAPVLIGAISHFDQLLKPPSLYCSFNLIALETPFPFSKKYSD
ncbi:hypothetical protein Pla52n_33730 [Stieleria varia]|uniref:Uncharacterized protein n=1 Tax=Stieleria varia TaxID=2528005 RepID=A0A5C6AQK5_9BACT|nr:hypothetical protein Pla52n_33730 [Stieleria varia]